MKKKLSKKEIADLKQQMRYWEKAHIDTVKHLFWHIDYIEEELEQTINKLLALKQESLFESHEKKMEAQAAWPTPSCTYSLEELPVDERGTVLNRLKQFKERGEVGSDGWNLNLKYSKLTHEEALKLLEINNA
jgi:hypothetical protein